MIAGITTTPSRTNYLCGVMSGLMPYARKIFLFNDIFYEGHWENTRRMYEFVLEQANTDEPVLVCTDDVIFTENWYEKFIKVHSVFNHHTYSLFSARPHTLKYEYSQLGVHKGNFYDQAIIFYNQKNLISKILNWINATNEKLDRRIREKKYFDIALQQYYVQNNIDWVLVIPNLVDHVGRVSNYKHKIGSSFTFDKNG